MGAVQEWEAVLLTVDMFGKIEREIDSSKSRTNTIQDYDFTVMPTNPPSTAVIVRAGKGWRNATTWAVIGYNVEKPTTTIDFASDVFGQHLTATTSKYLSLSFSSPYYYKAVSIGYDGDWLFYEQYGSDEYDFKWGYYGGETEYATVAEAEAEIDALLNGDKITAYGGPYNSNGTNTYQMPLWSFVLRNDGADGIMPIDRLNRGRSYTYRDMRPSKNWILA